MRAPVAAAPLALRGESATIRCECPEKATAAASAATKGGEEAATMDEEPEEGRATALADLAEFLVEEGLVLVVETARQLRT